MSVSVRPHILSSFHAASTPDPGVKKTATSGKPVAASSPPPPCPLSGITVAPPGYSWFRDLFSPRHTFPLCSPRSYLSPSPPHEEQSRCMQLTLTLLHIFLSETRSVLCLVLLVPAAVSTKAPAAADFLVHFEYRRFLYPVTLV